MDPSPGAGPSTFRAAVDIISPWIGAGGLTAILVAFFAMRAQRGPARPSTNTFAALYADHEQMADLVRALVRQTEAMEKVAAAAQRSLEAAERVVGATDRAAESTERLCATISRSAKDMSEAAEFLGERVARLIRAAGDHHA